MSLFVFSMLAGFLLYQAVSLIQPIGGTQDYRIGRRIVVHLPPETYLAWKATLIALSIVLFIFVSIVIVAQPFHPAQGYAYRFVDALTSPRMAAALFGGLVGLLVANLLNRILHQPPDYAFKPSDYLEIILILVLVVLGIGGEEVVQSYARRISKISVGATTEIAFSEARPRPIRNAAEQPGLAFKSTAPGDYFGGVGLRRLADLDFTMTTSDPTFIKVLESYEGASTGTVIDAGKLPVNVISPIGRCLTAITRVTGDATFVEEALSPLSKALWALAAAPDTDFAKIRENLRSSIHLLRDYAAPRLHLLRKPVFPGHDPPCDWTKVDDAHVEQLLDDQSLQTFKDSAKDAPYVAMANASAMAARKQYEAAAVIMYNWIALYRAGDSVAGKWYMLRARFIQGFFVDEWLRVRGSDAPSSLREYHLDNLEDIVHDMKSLKVVLEITRRNSGYSWSAGLLGISHTGDEGSCDIPDASTTPDGPTKLALRKVYESYLSARRDYVDHALKHPIMKVQSARQIEDEITDLMKIDLRCVSSEETPDRQALRAETIDRFVRSEINMMENLSPLESTDQVVARIKTNDQLLAFAIQLIAQQVADDRTAKAYVRIQARVNPAGLDPQGLHTRLSGDQSQELYENLLATRAQLRDFAERASNP